MENSKRKRDYGDSGGRYCAGWIIGHCSLMTVVGLLPAICAPRDLLPSDNSFLQFARAGRPENPIIGCNALGLWQWPSGRSPTRLFRLEFHPWKPGPHLAFRSGSITWVTSPGTVPPPHPLSLELTPLGTLASSWCQFKVVIPAR